jgi:hypothetical protein
MEMKRRPLPGRLAEVEFDGELPARRDVQRVFDELDYQMACQRFESSRVRCRDAAQRDFATHR